MLDDVGAAHRKPLDRGVESKMVLTVKPWGGMLALYRDNNSNFFIYSLRRVTTEGTLSARGTKLLIGCRREKGIRIGPRGGAP